MLIGSLLTRYFLDDGITQTPEWQALGAAELDAFESEVRRLLRPFTPRTGRNEANTERELIWPVLDALGWHDISVQESAGRFDVPDIALFPSPAAKAAAEAPGGPGPYAQAVAIAESKRWLRPLDRSDTLDSGRREGPPSSQINRYLTVLQGPSNHRLHWGILTNGRLWRLYYVMARSRSEDFLELDLPAILGLEGFADDMFAPPPDQRRHWLAVFYLLFRRQAFPAAADRRDCFLVRAVDEGQNWEARVADSLRAVVFDEVFPNLVAAIADHDPLRPRKDISPAFCAEVREGALVLLYRLLFLLYAEDRNLLPVADPKYDDYGLRRHIRNSVAERLDTGYVFAERLDNLFAHVRSLSLGVDQGEPALGLPPYNGGLFDTLQMPILGRVRIPDRKFAPIIDALSRTRKDGRPHRINFQDLSVRQLGSIYEGLLEFNVEEVDGRVRVIRDEEARHGSGSYYTPDPIVDLIVARVAQPPIDARLQAFRDKAEKLAAGRRPVADRLAALREVDSASAILSLKFCDPAMGSGHFLVALVDYLADRILEAIAEAESGVPWLPEDKPYVSPLTEAIDAVRNRILDQARSHGWRVTAAQLDDRLLVRRMILKRCIYGVDKNPMAVELAKVSLWLHTFTIGAPLSFLDHHLRCGDSILGDRVRTVADWLQQHGALHISRYVQAAKNTAQLMIDIERMVDADITEVKRSAETFAG
ncbi:MAG: restriction endonuclease, partial [Alphaproteobacteria bacterium]|nr:restriction endonuclease [Alphaproteobacteria bacterium]